MAARAPGAAMWLTTQWTLAIQMAWPKRTNNYGRNGSLSFAACTLSRSLHGCVGAELTLFNVLGLAHTPLNTRWTQMKHGKNNDARLFFERRGRRAHVKNWKQHRRRRIRPPELSLKPHFAPAELGKNISCYHTRSLCVQFCILKIETRTLQTKIIIKTIWRSVRGLWKKTGEIIERKTWSLQKAYSKVELQKWS